MRATARSITRDRLDQGELIRDDMVVMEQIDMDYRDTRYPRHRSIRTDCKAHHSRTILSCQESKSII